MKNEITIIERTNQRDGMLFVLETKNGAPMCPHCGVQMNARGDVFENAMCSCWWAGADDADYYAQVVVAATAEAEADYRAARARAAAEAVAKRREELARSRAAWPTADADGKFAMVHEIRYLWGKRARKIRARVRESIAGGCDFDAAMAA